MNKNVIIALVVVVLGGGIWWMMSGDSPQSVLDDTVAMINDCAGVDLTDKEAVDACKERDKELEKRWEAVSEGMTEEEAGEWERKFMEAVLGGS